MNIGVLGGGQLGRMLALAGIPLGLEFSFYDHSPQPCAAALGQVTRAEFDDLEQVQVLAQQASVVTVETENIPLAALNEAAKHTDVFPGIPAVEQAQDRLFEKTLFTRLGIPTPAYFEINTADDLRAAAAKHDGPLIVKTRRFGYDGKNQQLLDDIEQAEATWQALGKVPMIAEEHISFDREVSMIAVRNRNQEVCFYPLVENVHHKGILWCSTPLANDPLQAQAQDHISRLLDQLDYVGVMAFELFDCQGTLYANEMAPRVHNSGHWTIEGATTSQFENHLRAILGWPLGDTQLKTDVVMYNLIGGLPDSGQLLQIPGLHLHDYGKPPRPGRKIGHATLAQPEPETQQRLEQLILAARQLS